MATTLQKLQAFAAKRQFLVHQSVGGYLFYGQAGTAGLNALLNANPTSGVHSVSNPSNLSQVPAGSWVESQFNAPNGNPTAKLTEFNTLVRTTFAGGFDYFAMKFCFADFGEGTDVGPIWTAYQSVMDALETDFPGRLIHWTVPILPWVEGGANLKREELSDHIRTKYGATGRVFDLANFEMHGANGVRVTRDDPDTPGVVEKIPAMAYEWCADWTGSGTASDGHPNDTFSNAFAGNYLDLMYRVATEPASAMLTAHRTTGTAPVGIFFDAVNVTPATPGTQEYYASPYAWTSGVTQPADMEGSLWVWDFGDPYAGTWSTTGGSKNSATGYTAAHVYETPGIYTARLTLTSTAGVTTAYTQTVTVLDPDVTFASSTKYVAANGSDSAAGTQAAPYLTLGRAMTDVANGVAKRVLLRRGDTFNVGTSIWSVTANGPGHIGAYGTGARPIIETTSTGFHNVITFTNSGSSWPTASGADWRVVDLDFHNLAGTSDASSVGPDNGGRTTQNILMLRVLARNYIDGFLWQTWDLWAYEHSNEGIFLVDCEAGPNDGSGSMGCYGGGYHSAWLGNNLHDCGRTTGSHTLRVWQAHKAVISHNRLWNPGRNRHSLKLHSPSYAGDSSGPNGTRTHEPCTRWVNVTDNLMQGCTPADTSMSASWITSIGPQDTINEEWTSHIVYERNRHYGAGYLDSEIETSASHLLARDNIFDSSPNVYGEYRGIKVMRRGIEPVPTDIRFYNNTFYVTTSTHEAYYGSIDTPGAAALTFRNNLLVFPGGGAYWGPWGKDWAEGSGAPSPAVADHNLVTFVSAATVFTNAGGGDFTLTTGSPAIDLGVILPAVREDFARVTRAGRGTSYDLGAYESGLTASLSTSVASVSIRAASSTATTGSLTVRGTATAGTTGSVTVMPSAVTPQTTTATAGVVIAGPFTADAPASVSVEAQGVTLTAPASVSVIATSVMRIWGSDGGSNLTAESAIPIILAPPAETHAVAGLHMSGFAAAGTPASVSILGPGSTTAAGSVTIYGPTGFAAVTGSASVLGSSSAAIPGGLSVQGAATQSLTGSVTIGGTLTAGAPAGYSLAETRTATAASSTTINGTATASAAGSVTVNDAGSESADATGSVCLRFELSTAATASVTVRLGSADAATASVSVEGTADRGTVASVSVLDSLAAGAEASAVIASAGETSATASLTIDWSSSARASVVIGSPYVTTGSRSHHYATPATHVIMEDAPMISNFKIRVPYGTNFSHTLEFFEADRRTARDVSGCAVSLVVAASAAGNDGFTLATIPGANPNERILTFASTNLPSRGARSARLVIDSGGAAGPEDAASGMLYAE